MIMLRRLSRTRRSSAGTEMKDCLLESNGRKPVLLGVAKTAEKDEFGVR